MSEQRCRICNTDISFLGQEGFCIAHWDTLPPWCRDLFLERRMQQRRLEHAERLAKAVRSFIEVVQLGEAATKRSYTWERREMAATLLAYEFISAGSGERGRQPHE